MNRNYALILLGSLLALLLFSCVVTSAFAGFLWWNEAAADNEPAAWNSIQNLTTALFPWWSEAVAREEPAGPTAVEGATPALVLVRPELTPTGPVALQDPAATPTPVGALLASAASTATQEPTPALAPAQGSPTPAARATAGPLFPSVLPERDLFDLAGRLQGVTEAPTVTGVASPSDYLPGDRLSFWVHDVGENSFFSITATLSYETPHAYWWVQEGYEVPARGLWRSANNFEGQTYPTSRRYFGSEWNPGVDGDPHVYIVLGNIPGVAGYYSVPDEYPAQIRPYSNEHEIFYINLENAAPGNDYFDGILAHEFQHMIHWAIDPDEETWVNEGLSELAAQVNGYDVGPTDYRFSLDPDTQLTAWAELEDSAPHYGASHLFLAYFLEQFGEEAIRQLVREQANGIAGFDAVLAQVDPSQRRFEDLFAEWLVANYLDGHRQAGARYGYADLRIEPPSPAAEYTSFPAGQEATVHQYAADYIVLEGDGDLTIEFTGTLAVPLLGNETRSGQLQWWSNRGDLGDSTLTRAFDLTDLEQATLQAWMWHDLETDYDYAYVEISTDGGATWDLLTNDHTTTTNPSGNSYGPGFTGISGSGDEPRWVQEAFDLTPYTGQPVLVRFEVITDEALNRPGLALDGVSIPELGYSDDAEGHDGGWQAEGWVRVTDQIPQDWLVQLVTLGREIHVERMALDDQMHGAVTVAGLGQEVDRAVLVVSALAPATTEPATYSYKITQD